MSTMVVELRSDRLSGLAGLGEGYPDPYYGETLATMPVVMHALLGAIDPDDLDTSSPAGAAASLAAIGAAFDRTIRGHGAAKCALDIALHDLAGKATGDARPSAPRPLRGDPADRLHPGHRRAGGRRRAGPPRGALPGPQDQGGRPADLATLEAVRAVYDGPIRVDANTGWTPRRRRAPPPRAGAPRRRAHRAALPGPPLDRLGWLQAAFAAADRRRRERRRRSRTSTRWSAWSPGSTSSWPSAAASGRRRGCSPGPGSSASAPSSAAWRRRASGSPPRPPSRRLAEWVDLDGCLLLAEDPFEGLELGDDCRWRLGEAPGLGIAAGRVGGARPLSTAATRRDGTAVHRTPVPVDILVDEVRGQGPSGADRRPRRIRDAAGNLGERTATEPGHRDRAPHLRSDRPNTRGSRPRSVTGSGRAARGRRGASMEPTPHALDDGRPRRTRVRALLPGRRRVGWPELYDEMCAVASRGLFRGYGDARAGGPRDRLLPLRHAAPRGARGGGHRGGARASGGTGGGSPRCGVRPAAIVA